MLRSGLNYPFGLVLLPNGNLLVANRGDGTLTGVSQSGRHDCSNQRQRGRLFGTGIRFHTGLAGVTAGIGGVTADVLTAGAQGDFVGLDQINLSIPRSLAGRGEVDLELTVDGVGANTVRLLFR